MFLFQTLYKGKSSSIWWFITCYCLKLSPRISDDSKVTKQKETFAFWTKIYMQKSKSISSPELCKLCQIVNQTQTTLHLFRREIIILFFCNSRCGPMHDRSQVVQEHEKRSHDWYSLRLLFSRIAVFCPKCRRIWSGSSHVFTISEFTNLRIHEFFSLNFRCIVFLQGGSFLLR